MTKNIFMLILISFLLCGCSNQSPNPALDYIPSVRVSNLLEEGCAVIAESGVSGVTDSQTEPVYVYLYAKEPVYDLLISYLYEYTQDQPMEPIETSGIMYVPELAAGQALKIFDPYPYYYENGENYYTRIAYTKDNGEYQAVLLLGEKETPLLSPTEPCISGKIFDQQFFIHNSVSDDFYKKMLTGTFDAYVPKGMCISTGSLGDINSDGIEDALICLTTDGYRVAAYSGVMPLFVLIGQPGGGYVAEKKIAEGLFTPYRSSSYPVAGNGYIDIVYNQVGGAACHHTQICRFWYVPAENDWLLKEFSYQPSFYFDSNEQKWESLPPNLVRPLRNFTNLPLEKFSGSEYYDSLIDEDYFDAVSHLTGSSWGGNHEIYTLLVKLNQTTGYYEGYIHKYYESLDSGGFIQTIRGKYESDAKLIVASSDQELSFTIQDDTWIMDKHDSDAFHLAK